MLEEGVVVVVVVALVVVAGAVVVTGAVVVAGAVVVIVVETVAMLIFVGELGAETLGLVRLEFSVV